MSAPLKLVHLANFNSTNIGNGALISGLEHVLSADFPRQIQWSREAWDDYTFGGRQFDEGFVELVNAHDGLIVNGAVAIHGRDYLHQTGLRFELPSHLLARIVKPVVFYGISYRHFRGQPFHHQEALRRSLSEYAALPNVFLGVRNDGTKTWLAETLDLSPEVLPNIHEIPDSGVFIVAKKGDYPEILPQRKVIVLAPNDEDAVFRYGGPNVSHVRETGYVLNRDLVNDRDPLWPENRMELIRVLGRALTRIVAESGAQLLLVPHYFDDYRFISALVDTFKPQLAHQSALTTGLMRGAGTAFFYGRYQAADLSISMRVHSMSPCIGMGVPMIPVVTQPRMWDFLVAAGLEGIGMDAFSQELEDQLTEGSLNILSKPDERRHLFEQAREKMRIEFERINTAVFALFDSK